MSTSTSPIALAQTASPQGSTLMSMLPILLMFVVLYFLMLRPQMKRQKEHRNLVASLTKGDEVMTNSGILGRISQVNEMYVNVEVAQLSEKPVEITMQKTAISAVLPKGTIKSL